ncbi:major Facilitator Superfamily domain protein [Burkholderia pseudomallei MSHR840]|nr:major Facilitator Superfamily domain protein [Burkholderia pseudomallei MSHR840]
MGAGAQAFGPDARRSAAGCEWCVPSAVDEADEADEAAAARVSSLSIHRRVAARPAAHSGRLTKKMLRQPNCAISTPPITGPAAIEIAPDAVHQPTARARSRGSCAHAWLSSASEFGSIAAAASPCSARAAMSVAAFAAMPQTNDATAKSASPAANSRRAPNRSPSAPADSIRPASASV